MENQNNIIRYTKQFTLYNLVLKVFIKNLNGKNQENYLSTYNQQCRPHNSVFLNHDDLAWNI